MTSYDYWAKIDLKLPIHFLVDNDRTFVVKVDDLDCLLKFRESREPFSRGPGFGEAQNVELKHDRHGFFRSSNVLIHIPGPILDIDRNAIGAGGLITQEMNFEVLDMAFGVLNRFVDAYRVLSAEFHIRRFARSDLVGFWTVQIDWYKNFKYLISAAFGLAGPGITLARNPAPEEFQTELQDLLEKEQVPLYGLLLLDSKDYLESDDYRTAIVESRSALEVLIDSILWQALSATDINELRNTLKIPKGARFTDMQGALAAASINNKLKHGLRTAVGKSLADDATLWRRWLKVKGIREAVVHRGSPASRTDAENHVAVVEEIMNLLDVGTVSPNWKVTYVQSGSITSQPFE